MKAIQISFVESNGHKVTRYSAVKEEIKGNFYPTDKAVNFILAQTKDGKVYQGTSESVLFAIKDGITNYWFYKDNEDSDPFGIFGEREERGNIELRLINIID